MTPPPACDPPEMSKKNKVEVATSKLRLPNGDLIAEINLSQVLADRARNNACYMFTCEELAHALHLSVDAIYAAKRAGAPFPFGKSRPEWVLEFLKSSTGGQLSIKASY